jgi:formylglycine-generating enzyme
MRWRFQPVGCAGRFLYAGLMMAAVCLGSMMAEPALAAEGKRVAFVVGIGTYDNLSADKQLKNAVNDAEGVSAKLTEIGFQVTKAPNLTRPAFNAKWQNVLNSLTKDDTFVLFFSGHGVQIDGQNYLLPRDIPFIEYGRQAQLTREAISLNEILIELTSGDRTHPKQSVVILDACRDNPLIPPGYKSVSTSKGLAKVPESDGIFVLYAAASNRTALDRLSPNDPVKNSVFTRALLPLLGHKDLSIQELSTRLKDEVWTLAKTVNHDQRPTYYDGILGRFCLPGCAAKADEGTVGSKESSTATLLNMITGKDGAPMVLIPAGTFVMGAPDSEGNKDEHPRHQIMVDGFYMDKFEVTVARYAKSMRSGNNRKPAGWDWVDSKKHSKLPVVGVDWHDAMAYCEWAGKRLPTEAEWEKAARGRDERKYPWGNEQPTAMLANFGKEGHYPIDVYNYDLAPVDSHDAGNSPYGLHHMAGNVLEWTADWYDKNYYSKSPERNPTGPSRSDFRVLRGGCYANGATDVRSSVRRGVAADVQGHPFGFRCAQDVPK